MLKGLDEVFDSDPRYRNMVVGTPGDIRYMSLADHHGYVAAISLRTHVPTSVRTIFERARNAFLYAWFVYDLTPLAQAQGYAALEMALRERLGPRPDGKKWGGLGPLIAEARKRGLLDTVPLEGAPEEHAAQLDHIVLLSRMLRNEIAHGSEHLGIPGMALQSLEDCALLINHIFDPSASKAP